MPRVLVAPDALHDDTLTISDRGTLHHLLHVLRLKAGDPLECFDGSGRSYAGRIIRCLPDVLTISIDRRMEEPPPLLRLTLAQALIKPERFEWVIEKATELGVSRIVPIVTSRTTVQRSSGNARLSRWRRIAEAAATQCGRSTLPVIEEPQRLERFLETLDGCQTLLPTLTEAGRPLTQYLRGLQRAEDIVVLIGPEGDFSPQEVTLAKRHGAHPVRLGRLILRSETAAVAMLTLLQHTVGVL